MSQNLTKISESLFKNIKKLISESKNNVAVSVNSELTFLYWNIGKYIKQEIIKTDRADYGKQVIFFLSKQLTQEFGRGWSENQLRHCIRFAETVDETILSALRRELTCDLKIGEFEASFKGQMELYLRYLEKYETFEGENFSLGLILCSGKNNEHIELLRLDESNISAAEYLTVLSSQKSSSGETSQSN